MDAAVSPAGPESARQALEKGVTMRKFDIFFNGKLWSSCEEHEGALYEKGVFQSCGDPVCEIVNGEFRFQGQATPGGECGTVEIVEVKAKRARK